MLCSVGDRARAAHCAPIAAWVEHRIARQATVVQPVRIGVRGQTTMLVDLALPSGRIARRDVPIANLDLPAARSTAGKRRPLPGEEPRGVAPRTRELPHGTISGEEGVPRGFTPAPGTKFQDSILTL